METMETREAPAPRLISIRLAAELANVSRVHVWRLIQRGEIEAIRVGENGPLRVDRERFLGWLYDDPRSLAAEVQREPKETT
jgi:excisionase family DNA binding protein